MSDENFHVKASASTEGRKQFIRLLIHFESRAEHARGVHHTQMKEILSPRLSFARCSSCSLSHQRRRHGGMSSRCDTMLVPILITHYHVWATETVTRTTIWVCKHFRKKAKQIWEIVNGEELRSTSRFGSLPIYMELIDISIHRSRWYVCWTFCLQLTSSFEGGKQKVLYRRKTQKVFLITTRIISQPLNLLISYQIQSSDEMNDWRTTKLQKAKQSVASSPHPRTRRPSANSVIFISFIVFYDPLIF